MKGPKAMSLCTIKVGVYIALGLVALGLPQAARAGFTLGPDATNYALLFEGAGSKTLQITNVTINGNVGVGMTGKATDSGPATISGRIDFTLSDTGQFSSNNGSNVITGGVHYNVAAVADALNYVNNLNATLGGEAGTGVNIGTGSGKTLTINASDGILDANGNEVFTVTGFNTTNGDVLIINGDLAGHSVVLNFTQSVNFNNQVKLVGLTSDQVLYNFVGGNGLTGGPTLQINDNLGTHTANCSLGVYCVQGVFLNPNGPISVTNANVVGRVFGGDTHDFQYVSGSKITAEMSPVPEPTTVFVVTGFSLAIVLASRRGLKRS